MATPRKKRQYHELSVNNDSSTTNTNNDANMSKVPKSSSLPPTVVVVAPPAIAAAVPVPVTVTVSVLSAEYQSLIRISHRIDIQIDTIEKFQSIVLDKLLLKLFIKLKNNYQAILVLQLSSVSPLLPQKDENTTTTTTTDTTTASTVRKNDSTVTTGNPIPTTSTTTTTILDVRQQIHQQLIHIFSQISQRLSQEQPSESSMCIVPCLELLRQLFFATPTSRSITTSSSSSHPKRSIITTDTNQQPPLPSQDVTTTTTTTVDSSTSAKYAAAATITATKNHVATWSDKSNFHSMDAYTINFALTFLNIGLSRRCRIYSTTKTTKTTKNNNATNNNTDLVQLLPLLFTLYHDVVVGMVHDQQQPRPTVTVPTTPIPSPQYDRKIAHLIRMTILGVTTTTVTTTTTSRAVRSNTDTGLPLSLSTTRTLLQQPSATTAPLVYDLCLDLLLYIPQLHTSTIPPPGLSQMAWQRLLISPSTKNTHSSTYASSNWSNERHVLVQNQSAIYQMIAPQQTFRLFCFNESSDSTTSIPQQRRMIDENMARMVVAMIIASCSAYQEVSQRATLDLKHYLDRTSTTISAGSSSRHRSSISGSGSATSRRTVVPGNNNNDDVCLNGPSSLLGDPMMVAMELMSLCLGQIHSDRIIMEHPQPTAVNNKNDSPMMLGFDHRQSDIHLASEQQQQLLQWKRRPLDEVTQCPMILSFITNQIFNEYIHLFEQETNDTRVIIFSKMTVQLLHRMLCSTSIIELSTLRAKPYIAAAELLNVFTIRLSVYYDSDYDRQLCISDATATEDTSDTILTSILCRCLSIACTVLSPIAISISSNGSRSTTSSNNDGSLTVRDSCYGVIATLSRSTKFVVHKHGYLFGRGNASIGSTSEGGGDVLNIDTASLLFGCTANEDERLRPRSVAALDALLAAYRRFIATPSISQNGKVPTGKQTIIVPRNPWEKTTHIVDKKPFVNHTGLSNLLRTLFWSVVRLRQSTTACRVAAARWSCDLLKEIDLLGACQILCFLAGDIDTTVASIARDGIGLSKQLVDDDEGMLAMKTTDYISTKFPDFGDFTSMMFPDVQTTSRQHYWDFSYTGKAATLRCALYCLLNDFYSVDNDIAVTRYLAAITITLQEVEKASNRLADDASMQKQSSVDLLDECSACLLAIVSSSPFARRQLVQSTETSKLALRCIDIPNLALTANSSRSRRYLAGVFGNLLKDMNLWSIEETTLTSWVGDTTLLSILSTCDNSVRDVDKRNPTLSRLHGSAFVGAHVIQAMQLLTTEDSESQECEEWWILGANILESLGRGIMHDDDIVSNACSDSLSIAFSRDGNDAPLNVRLHKSVTVILSNLAKALNKYGHSDTVNPARTLKLAKACGICLAATAVADKMSESTNGVGMARHECVNALFELLGSAASRKTEEVSIVVGEALADFADAYSLTNIELGNVALITWPTEFDDDYSKQLPSQEKVLYTMLRKVFLATSPHKRIACAPALLAVVACGARRLNTDPTMINRPLAQSLLRHLKEVQLAFLTLMSDPKGRQFSRESSCIGLAACRGLVKYVSETESGEEQPVADLNNRLLRTFGQTTNFGGSAMIETEAQALARRAAEGTQRTGESHEVTQSEIGGASGIGEAALGAYREMASASVSLGRHDIMYGLLFLSLSHTYWLTSDAKHRYSATSLLGESLSVGADTNSAEFRTTLRPFLGNLIPRILRGCHDPNKQTKEQMTSLWRGLTGGGADGREAISQHLISTVDALIEECSSKLWRARVGACCALSEVVVGKEWEDFGGGGPILSDDDMFEGGTISAGVRLVRIWNAASRALDDVQGAVRDSGGILARAARALTIRLCSSSANLAQQNVILKKTAPNSSNVERDAASAAGTSLWWLMCKGLNHTCPEVTGASMSTLVEIVGVVRPGILEPSLPTLLNSLLLAVSALEPAALNYMQLRTTDQEGLERARLQLAQTGPLALALTKCLEVVPRSKLETQQTIASALDSALRQSAGFATRAATADAVSNLCTSCPAVFRFSGSTNSNPSVRLLRAFYFASERERGTGAKDKMIHALGNLASICPASSVRSLAVRACERYRYSTGNNFDPSSRRAAAAALRTIAVRASNVFSDGGRGDIWCKRVLPVAFIGRKDSDAKIASMWQEVWDEGGSVTNVSDSSFDRRNYGTQLEEKLLQSLVKECVAALQDVSWASRVAGASALQDLCTMRILSPASRSQNEEGPALLRAQNRATASHVAITQCIQVMIKPRLWNGKFELLKALTLLVSRWISATVSDNGESRDEKKLDEFVMLRPWWPVVISHGNYNNDLFVNDGWFLHDKLADDLDEGELNSSVLESTKIDVTKVAGDRSPINFQHCDSVLELEEVADLASDIDDVRVNFDGVVTLKGLSRLLVDYAIPSSSSQRATIDLDVLLVYRNTAFSCFRDLLNSVPPSYVMTKSELYVILSPALLSMLTVDKDVEKRSPPVLTAGAINCIESLLWEGVGEAKGDCDVSQLIAKMKEIGGGGTMVQPAWTVRAASAQCIGQITRLCDDCTIQHHTIITQIVDVARHALTDKRCWKVRVAGLTILSNLVQRGGHHHHSDQRNLESLLPHKEVIQKLVRSSFNDTESNVTMIATTIVKQMSWWP